MPTIICDRSTGPAAQPPYLQQQPAFATSRLLSKQQAGSERKMAVLRYNLILLAVGGLTMVAIIPRDQADAQSGQAFAFAEHTCLEYRVTPGTRTFQGRVVSPAHAL